jgi:hypothetical protein
MSLSVSCGHLCNTSAKWQGNPDIIVFLFILQSNKPLMERKRRERINNCLQQLKSILMEVTKKEVSYI